MAKPKVRKGMPSVQLTRDEVARRVRQRFYDPAFEVADAEIERIIEVAWEGYDQ